MIEELQELTGEISLNQELTGELDKIVEVIEPVTQEKEITPTKQTQSVQPDEGYNGLSQVTVNPIPPEYIIPALDSKSITANGTYNAAVDLLDGYSSVSVDVPSGGGVVINGQLVSREIQSGSVSKGDFVKRGGFTSHDRISDSAHYRLATNCSVENEANLFDDNDNTYASITGMATYPRIYIQCKNRETLGIPSNAILKNVICNFKISWRYTASSYPKKIGAVRYADGNINTVLTSVGTFMDGVGPFPMSDKVEYFDNYISPNADTSEFGVQFYSTSTTANTIYLYYVTFDIYYEYDSKINKLSANGDTIFGIANENGSEGDTIEVFIPNVE